MRRTDRMAEGASCINKKPNIHKPASQVLLGPTTYHYNSYIPVSAIFFSLPTSNLHVTLTHYLSCTSVTSCSWYHLPEASSQPIPYRMHHPHIHVVITMPPVMWSSSCDLLHLQCRSPTILIPHISLRSNLTKLKDAIMC